MTTSPAPIQENTTAANGKFRQVWIRWFQDLVTRIDEIDTVVFAGSDGFFRCGGIESSDGFIRMGSIG